MSNRNFSFNISTNSDLVDFLDSFYFGIGVYESLIPPFGILGNLAVIVSILNCKSLRKEFRYLVVVSMAICDLLISLVVCTNRAYWGINGRVIHGCLAQILVTVFEKYIQHFVAAWGIFTITTTYLLNLCGYKFRPMSKWGKRVLFGILLVIPWLAMVMILPFVSKEDIFIRTKVFCTIVLKQRFGSFVSTLAYMLPVSVSLIESVVIIIFYLKKTPNEEIAPPWAFVCGALVMLIPLPEYVAIVLRPRLQKGSIKQYIRINNITVVLADAKSGILPFIWFINPRIREASRNLWNRVRCKPQNNTPEYTTAINYNDLRTTY